jgi:hypothetical protein
MFLHNKRPILKKERKKNFWTEDLKKNLFKFEKESYKQYNLNLDIFKEFNQTAINT